MGDQTIQGRVNFTSDLYAKGNVNVTGLVNGLDLDEDAVTLDRMQNVAGKCRLDMIIIEINV